MSFTGELRYREQKISRETKFSTTLLYTLFRSFLEILPCSTHLSSAEVKKICAFPFRNSWPTEIWPDDFDLDIVLIPFRIHIPTFQSTASFKTFFLPAYEKRQRRRRGSREKMNSEKINRTGRERRRGVRKFNLTWANLFSSEAHLRNEYHFKNVQSERNSRNAPKLLHPPIKIFGW